MKTATKIAVAVVLYAFGLFLFSTACEMYQAGEWKDEPWNNKEEK